MPNPVRVIQDLPGDLAGRAYNVHSQFGEDGLIEAVFDVVPPLNHLCFEIGCADGMMHSNTALLINKGWSATLLEKDPSLVAKAQAAWKLRHDVDVCQFEVKAEAEGPNSLNHVIRGTLRYDLGVLDIDGDEYGVWRNLDVDNQPWVMLVEYAPHRGDSQQIGSTIKDQTGYVPIERLGRQKGYVPVARTATNVLFVDAKRWEARTKGR